MTRDGFEALAQAYGGDMARWPQDHWDEAALFAAQQPDLAAGVLAAAARLDEALDAWRPLAVSHRLREAVVAAAPAPRARRRVHLATAVVAPSRLMSHTWRWLTKIAHSSPSTQHFHMTALLNSKYQN